jgi:hypothetical protein
VEVRRSGLQALRAGAHVAWRENDALNGIDIIDRPWQVKSGRSKQEAAFAASTRGSRDYSAKTRVRRSMRLPIRHAAAFR